MTIAELMSRRLVCVDLDAPVTRVQELFADHHCHHVLVVERGRLRGVISDRDVLRAVSCFAGSLAEQRRDEATTKTKAHQLMARRIVAILPDATPDEAARVLLENGISCLPVLDDSGHLLGVITWRDLLRALVGAAESLPRGL